MKEVVNKKALCQSKAEVIGVMACENLKKRSVCEVCGQQLCKFNIEFGCMFPNHNTHKCLPKK